MIKRYIYLIFILLIIATITGFILFSPPTVINNNLTLGRGEVIEYRAHYGFLNAAVGRMIIDDSVFQVNGRPCYKIDIFGESVGMFDFMLRIRDNWGTYLDTEHVLPQRFWRKIREGKYRKFEIVDFNQDEDYATVVKYDYKKKKWRDKTYFKTPSECQDLVSGYYFLRTLDFNQLQDGDTITIDGFFDDEVYHFNIVYLGKEELKTDIGQYRTRSFAPVMPENKLFKGENSIRFWLSDDENKIPLKIRANMFVGAVEIDITRYQPGQR